MKTNKSTREYLRNFIFGVEDSLVSTIGLVSGVAVAGASPKSVILTGMVLIFVEAFSMGAGSLLSENSADEYEGKKEVSLSRDAGYAVVMFVSYLVSGFLIVLPYVFLSPDLALWLSITVAIVGLFILGVWSAKLSGVSGLKRGTVMSLIGGITILLGIAVGAIVGD